MLTCTKIQTSSAAHAFSRTTLTLTRLMAAGFTMSWAFPAHAADDASCAPMRRAQTAITQTSFQETVTVGSHPPRQIIVTPTTIYLQTPDGWISAAANAATRTRFVHMLGNSLTNCRRLRSEQVDGQTADVYTVDSRSASGKDNVITVWLSRSNHLPVRSESDVGSESGGTRHVSVHLRYDDVQAPGGAKQEIDLNSMFGRHG